MKFNQNDPLELLCLSIIGHQRAKKEVHNLRKKVIHKNIFGYFQTKAIIALHKFRDESSDDSFIPVALKYRDILLRNGFTDSQIQELFSEFF